MITVVSACYGDYDDIRPAPEMEGVEFVLVTDRTPAIEAARGWAIIEEPRPHLHSRMAAKYPKLFPWEYVSPGSHHVIWADTSVEFKGEHLDSLVGLVRNHSMAMWKHPWRDDVTDEALASEGMPKYKDQPVSQQAAYYERWGLPHHWGLWATGLCVYGIAWRSEQEELAHRWLAEMVRWTYQDQLSLPYVAWNLSQRPAEIPVGWHLDNPWVTFNQHRSEL